MITENQIKNELNKLIGQDYTNFGISSKVRDALKDLFTNNNIPIEYEQDQKYVMFSNDKQVVTMKYRRYSIGEIKVKKAKGKVKFSYYGSHSYEWSIDGFEVVFYGDQNNPNKTIEDRLKEIDTAAENAINDAAARKKESAEVVKSLMASTGKDYYDVIRILELATTFRYNDEFQKMCGKA